MAERKIDLVAATSIVVANMIGTGVFTSIGFQLEFIQVGFPILAIWLVGGILALLGALSYAELATRLPEDGGEYYFLSKIYHPAMGFMAGFVSSTVGFAAPIALVAIALGEYMGGIFPGIHKNLVASSAILLIATVHLTNLKAGVSFQKVFTFIKVGAIIVFIALGFMHGNVQHVSFLPTDFSSDSILNIAFAVSLVWVSFAYSGWNASAYIAGEIKNPERNISRSILWGTLLVTFLYLLINMVFMMTTPVESMLKKPDVGLISSKQIFGENAGNVFGGIISLLLISTISSMIIAGPRVLQSMFSKIQGLQVISKTDKDGNPTRSIIFLVILSLILMFTVNFPSLIYYTAFTLSLFTILTVTGVIVMRIKHGKPNGYKAFGYPLTPIVFVLTTLGVAFFFVYDKPKESLIGLGTALLGGLLYFASTDFKKK